jgi:hypothetical protein
LKRQSFSGLCEGTRLQMRCASRLTFGILAISILPFHVRE